ncbi:MAG: redox-sensing transcriptional repressor Rex [Candidatus Omnitrophica bacterium]|nr:redox-sensing transcriptional repressor Rex [Candidatus Omnitrophota bacterium]MCA9402206.1 redox-sensing transcriptional repressor Rex [Candidatus Omnitrophota bacterium]
MKTPKHFIKRLYQYRQALFRLQKLGFVRIYSDDLAEAIGVTAVQVRKDFSLFAISGNKRGGYVVAELINQLNNKLGKNETQEAILVGAGNIGRALLQYDGFSREGIRLVAAFDIDPARHDAGAGIPVLPFDDMSAFVRREGIITGIIAVPVAAAQQVMDKMVGAGIRGILNFAPVVLKAPEEVFVDSINLVLELETVNYFAQAYARDE